jgi:uncharacterized protein YlaI
MKLIVICAWCGKFIRFKDAKLNRPPKNPITHGICPDCKQILEKETEKVKGGDYETQYQTSIG